MSYFGGKKLHENEHHPLLGWKIWSESVINWTNVTTTLINTNKIYYMYR